MSELLSAGMRLYDAWDTACSKAMRNFLVAAGLKELQNSPSPATAHLPFVASPTPLISSLLGYLVVVCASSLLSVSKPVDGTKRRDPAWLRAGVQLHNAVLIFLSGYMCLGAVYEAVRNGYSFWGNDYSAAETGMARIVWIFYVSKLYEFIDTFIMILKGNMRQVSFLHVYHHASISTIWWAIAYVAPGGDAYYSVALNSLVHVIMYTYYFMASLLGKDEKLRKKYLWWGQYLTMFQMFQFVTMMGQAAYCMYTGTYNQFLATLLFYYMLTLLALFGNFFVQKYTKRSKQRPAGSANGVCGTNGNGVADAGSKAKDA